MVPLKVSDSLFELPSYWKKVALIQSFIKCFQQANYISLNNEKLGKIEQFTVVFEKTAV